MAGQPEPTPTQLAREFGQMLLDLSRRAYGSVEAFAACVAAHDAVLIGQLRDQADPPPTGPASDQLAELMRRAAQRGEMPCTGSLLVALLRACQHCIDQAPTRLPDGDAELNELARFMASVELALQRARDVLGGAGLLGDVDL